MRYMEQMVKDSSNDMFFDGVLYADNVLATIHTTIFNTAPGDANKALTN